MRKPCLCLTVTLPSSSPALVPPILLAPYGLALLVYLGLRSKKGVVSARQLTRCMTLRPIFTWGGSCRFAAAGQTTSGNSRVATKICFIWSVLPTANAQSAALRAAGQTCTRRCLAARCRQVAWVPQALLLRNRRET